jgi:hypothetical protein
MTVLGEEKPSTRKKVIVGIVIGIMVIGVTVSGIALQISQSLRTSREVLVDYYGINVGSSQQSGNLWGYLSTHQPSQTSYTSGHGSVFYAPASFRISHVTLCVFLYNGSVTADITLDLYTLTTQSYLGLPIGSPLASSLTVNASTITASGSSGTGDYLGPIEDLNFSFHSNFVFQSGTYYGLALQIGPSGKIYTDNSGSIGQGPALTYGMVGVFFYNTTISARSVFMFQNSNWLNDAGAVDCLMQMAIYGYYA